MLAVIGEVCRRNFIFRKYNPSADNTQHAVRNQSTAFSWGDKDSASCRRERSEVKNQAGKQMHAREKTTATEKNECSRRIRTLHILDDPSTSTKTRRFYVATSGKTQHKIQTDKTKNSFRGQPTTAQQISAVLCRVWGSRRLRERVLATHFVLEP